MTEKKDIWIILKIYWEMRVVMEKSSELFPDGLHKEGKLPRLNEWMTKVMAERSGCSHTLKNRRRKKS